MSSSAHNGFTEEPSNANIEVETPDVQDPIFRNVQRVRAQQAYVEEIKTTKFRSARELLELLDEVQDGWWSKDIILASLSKLTSLARRGDRLKSEVGDSLRLSPDTRLMSLANGSSQLAGTEELGAEARYAHVLRCAAEQVASSASSWSDKELVAVLRLLKPAAQEADAAFANAVCDAISSRMLAAPHKWGVAQLTATLQSAATAPGVPLDFISLCSEQLANQLQLTAEPGQEHTTAPSISALSAAIVAVRDALHFKALAGELGALQGGGQLPPLRMRALLQESDNAVLRQLEAGGMAPDARHNGGFNDAVVPRSGDTPAVTQARVHALALRELQASLELPAIASSLPTLPQPSWRAVSRMQPVRKWHMDQEHDVHLGVQQERSLLALSSPSNSADVLQTARFAQSCNDLAEAALIQMAGRSGSEWKGSMSTKNILKTVTAVAELLPGTQHSATAVSAASAVLSQDLPELDESSCAQCLAAITRVLDAGFAQELQLVPGDIMGAPSAVQGSLQLLLSVCHRLSVELQQQLELVGDRTQLTAHERRRYGKKNKQALADLVHREQLHYTRADIVQLVNFSADALQSIQTWLSTSVPSMTECELLHVGKRVRPSSTSDPVELATAGMVALRHVLGGPLLAATESHSSRMPPGELLSVLASYRAAGMQEGALEALAVPAGTAAATGPADVAVAVAHEYWRAGYGSELQWLSPESAGSASERSRDALRATVKRMEAARSGDLASTLSALQALDGGPTVLSKGDAVLQALQIRVQRETPDLASGELTQLLGLMSDMGLRHHATFAAAASQLHERVQHWPAGDLLHFLGSLPPAEEFTGDAVDAVKFAVMAASDALTPPALSVYRGGGLPDVTGLDLTDAEARLAGVLQGGEGGSHEAGPLASVEPWAAAATARIVAQHGVVNSSFTLSAVHSALSRGAVGEDSFLDIFKALSDTFASLEARKYSDEAQHGTAAGLAMEAQRQEDLAWHARALGVTHSAWLSQGRGGAGSPVTQAAVATSLQAHVAAIACGATGVQDVLPFLRSVPGLLRSACSGDQQAPAPERVGDSLQHLARYLVDGPLLHNPSADSAHALCAVMQAAGSMLPASPSFAPHVLSIAASAAEAASRSTQVQDMLLGELNTLLSSACAVSGGVAAGCSPVQVAATVAASTRCAGYISCLPSAAAVQAALQSSIRFASQIMPAGLSGGDFASSAPGDVVGMQLAAVGTDSANAPTAALAWLDALDTVTALSMSPDVHSIGPALQGMLEQASVAVAAAVGCADLPQVEDAQGTLHSASFPAVTTDGLAIMEAFGSVEGLMSRLRTLLSAGTLPADTFASLQAAHAALMSHKLAQLLQREGDDEEDMTELSAEMAAVHDSLLGIPEHGGGGGGGAGWSGQLTHAQAELALARSIVTAAQAAGLTTHGVESGTEADHYEPDPDATAAAEAGGEQQQAVMAPKRGFTGKLQSMLDSFLNAGDVDADADGVGSSSSPQQLPGGAQAAGAPPPEWSAELHPTEGLLAALTTIAPGSPASTRVAMIVDRRASPEALGKMPADSESLSLALQQAAALLTHWGLQGNAAAASTAVHSLAQHARHILAEMGGERVETEAVLAAAPVVGAALAESPVHTWEADGPEHQLLSAMHASLLFCAEQDAQSHDATLALQNCASLASVATGFPGTSAGQAADWAEAVKDSLHTALANAPEWEAPRDSLGERLSADVDRLLQHGIPHTGPAPLRMRRLLQWYIEEQKRAAEVDVSAGGAPGVQRLFTTPRSAEPTFLHGATATAQQGRAAVAAARETREAAAALQDGFTPLSPPLLRLMADMLSSAPLYSSRQLDPALVLEVQHCTRLCLPALWAHIHDGLLQPSVLVETCGSLLRLAEAGVSVRAPYSLPPPRSQAGGSQISAGEGNMLLDTAHFMMASLLQRHMSHVQQTVVAQDGTTTQALGSQAVVAISKAPALRLAFADRVSLLQCVVQTPGVLEELPGALRLVLWGLCLPDEEGDCVQSASLPAATDAISVVRTALGEDLDSYIDAACVEQLLQLSQGYASLMMATAKLLAPPLDSVDTARESFLDSVDAESIEAACVHGLLELALYLQDVQAAHSRSAAVAPGQVPAGVAGCLAAAAQAFAEQLKLQGGLVTQDPAVLHALDQFVVECDGCNSTAVDEAAACLRSAAQRQ